MRTYAPVVIDAETIKALRTSRSIVFKSQLGTDGLPIENAVSIHIYHQDTKGPTMTVATRATLRNYTQDLCQFANGRCSEVVFNYPNQVTAVGTVFAMLKAGDRISIAWEMGASTSKSLEEKGIFGDDLYLDVQRPIKGSSSVKDYRFLLERRTSTDPLNRMVLHEGK